MRRSLGRRRLPALEVEVLAFEEVIGPGLQAPRGPRRQLKAKFVHDDEIARLERTYTFERPVDANGKGEVKTFAASCKLMLLALSPRRRDWRKWSRRHGSPEGIPTPTPTR